MSTVSQVFPDVIQLLSWLAGKENLITKFNIAIENVVYNQCASSLFMNATPTW